MLESFSRTGNCEPNQLPAIKLWSTSWYRVPWNILNGHPSRLRDWHTLCTAVPSISVCIIGSTQAEQEQNWKGIQLLRTGYWKLLNSVECSNIIRIRLENGEIRRRKMRTLKWILKGVPNISFHLNVSLFDCVQSYILETNSFTS